MKLPKNFLAIYSCTECDSELEMFNCYVPYFSTYCEDCDSIQRFHAEKVIHKSFDWDRVEDGTEIPHD